MEIGDEKPIKYNEQTVDAIHVMRIKKDGCGFGRRFEVVRQTDGGILVVPVGCLSL